MITTILVFIAGLVLGALLNVAIIRLPREKRLLGWPRCTRTGEALAWWQLLPVLGWAIQRGRARNGRPLHWIYPLVEVLTALIVTLIYTRYGFTITFFYLTFVAAVLLVTGAIDWLYRYIYTFVILGAALLALLLGGWLPSQSLLNAGLGAVVAGVVFILLFMLAKILFPGKAAPFGMGDVYLGIFIGAAFGLTRLGAALTYGVFMAGIVAAVIVVLKRWGRRSDMPEYISYGTYLCLGAIVYIVVWGL